MSLITDEIRAAASEMYHGDEICQEKTKLLLKEVNLPNGLLPLKDIQEVGYVKETGFVWLIQKKKSDHKFEKVGRPAQYAKEVTAYVEPNRIKKLTGVKTKELLIWVTLSDIYVDDPPTGKITFKTPTGLFRSFPVEAFHIEEKPAAATVKKDVKVGAPEDPAVTMVKNEVKVGAPPAVKKEVKVGAPPAVKNEVKVGAPPVAKKEVKVGAPPAVRKEVKVGAPPAVKNEMKVGAPRAVEVKEV